MNCPECDSQKIVKNGSIHNGKKKYLCRECGRQLIENPAKKVIPQSTWDIVGKLLSEKIPMSGISEPWLQKYISKKYEDVDKETDIVKKRAD